VTGYTLLVKPSAQKELDAFENKLVARLVAKIEGLIENPRPSGCTKLRGSATSGVFGLAITESCMPSMTKHKRFRSCESLIAAKCMSKREGEDA
jgi:hypothetical protein